MELQEYAAAETYFAASLEIRRAIGHRDGIAGVLANLGNLKAAQADYQSALTYAEQSKAIFTEIGDRDGVAACWLNMGTSLLQLGEYTAAWTHIEQSFAISVVAQGYESLFDPDKIFQFSISALQYSTESTIF